MKKESSAKPAKKTAKQELAAGAAKLRKEIAAEKAKGKPAKAPKAASKAKPPAKPKKAKVVNVDAVIAPLEVCTDPIAEISARRLTMSEDGKSMVLDPETPMGEYVRLFDSALASQEQSQWIIGGLINQGQAIYGEKFAVAMAATGRPLSTLKSYAYVERQVPPDLRLLPYSHCAEVAKVTDLEKKRKIIHDAVKQTEAGHPMTVKEIRKEADKAKPRKSKPKKPKADKHIAKPELALSTAEKELYDDLEDTAAKLERQIEGAAFVLEMSPKQTATLREKLDRIARFAAQIS